MHSLFVLSATDCSFSGDPIVRRLIFLGGVKLSSTPSLCLVIPCYNEEKRLSPAKFAEFAKSLAFVFVNDGSSDSTSSVLAEMKKTCPGSFHVLNLEKNQGKAEAVRRGMLFAAGEPALSCIEWIGFWDADLSTPLSEAPPMLDFASSSSAAAVFGSRIMRPGAKINRSFFRHMAGRLFAFLARLKLNAGVYDSQCGAKIFRRRHIQAAFSRPFQSRWIFDLEIILRLDGRVIAEYPLSEWNEISGSKLMSLSSMWGIFGELWTIGSSETGGKLSDK